MAILYFLTYWHTDLCRQDLLLLTYLTDLETYTDICDFLHVVCLFMLIFCFMKVISSKVISPFHAICWKPAQTRLICALCVMSLSCNAFFLESRDKDTKTTFHWLRKTFVDPLLEIHQRSIWDFILQLSHYLPTTTFFTKVYNVYLTSSVDSL